MTAAKYNTNHTPKANMKTSSNNKAAARRVFSTVAIAMAVMPAMLSAQGRAAQSGAATTLIRNATVITVSDKGTLQNADILIKDGKIAEIGSGIQAPAGANIVDATGKYVMPGIIDPHSHMMSDAINEGSLSVTSMTRITDVLNPTNVNIYRALAGGVTTLNILHGSANTIGGQNATVKLKYGRPVAEYMFEGAPPGIKFALGENVTRKNRQQASIPGQPATQPRYPVSRMGQTEVIRDAFTRARDYKADWDEHRARVAKGDRNSIAPRRDLELEPLAEILEGKRLVHAHTYRSDETLMLLKVAEEFGFKIRTLQHGLEGYKIASEIAAHGAGLSTFADSWSYKIEAYDAIPHNAAILIKNGVNTTINSDSDERIRRLNIDAAKLMRYGNLSEEDAFKTITLSGAWQLGVEDKVGSLEVGKHADIAIWSAHPFSVYANVEQTWIEGVKYFDRKEDIADREARERERTALLQSERNTRPANLIPEEL